MKRVALYCRVSSDRQAKEGDSIPAQLDALRKYAKENRYDVVGEYVDDGISGTKDKRDELQRLLDAVRADRVDLIIVTKMDRLHRSLRNFLNMQDLLQKHGCNWLAILEPIYDSSTPQGRMIINTMMNLAEFEAGQTSDRIRQVQSYKVKQREVISGTVTPGYRIEDKHLVIDDKADAVKLAFETYNKTGSFADTIRATYGLGLPTTSNGMKQLLTREIYTGRSHGLDDFAPRIISDSLFDSVQRQISLHRRQKSDRVYLFSGLLRCAECGAVMAACSRQKSYGSRHLMYRCPKHFQRAVKQCGNSKIVYESVLERYLVGQFPTLIIDQINVLEAKQRPIQSLQAQREKIARKIERLKELYLNELITMEEYKTDKERLQKDLDAIPLQDTAESSIDALKSLVGLNLEEIYTDMSRPEKRLFWRTVVKEIRFDRERHFFVDFV